MFSTTDTIVAIATPPGRGGLGVIRLSGPEAFTIVRRLTGRDGGFEPRRATLAVARACGRGPGESSREASIDQVMVTCFPSPASYTGDDVAEISAHGSPVVLERLIEAAIGSGARLAGSGEFTLRAYLNGKIDLAQAEAVGDLVDAVTPFQAQAAFDQLQGTLTRTIRALDERLFDLAARLEASIDFPEEGYHFIDPAALGGALDDLAARLEALAADGRRGRLVREGLHVVIVGRPNVGKSTLFNALAGAPRAIVTDVPGTTRDLIAEVVDVLGIRVTLVDTAGLRASAEAVEQEGIARAEGALGVADVALVVLDGSRPLDHEDRRVLELTAARPRVVVANKADVVAGVDLRPFDALPISALTGAGLDGLRARLVRALGCEMSPERPAITNVRHLALVERAHAAVASARSMVADADRRLPEEFVLADLQDARDALEAITGRRTPDDVLAHVFARFCIGK